LQRVKEMHEKGGHGSIGYFNFNFLFLKVQ
jgi:hypothetical protein